VSANSNPYSPPQKTDEEQPASQPIFHSSRDWERSEYSDTERLPLGWTIRLRVGAFLAFLGTGLASGYILLAIRHPVLWAIGNAVLIVLAFGLLTTKVLFRFERPIQVWALAPVFGSGWLLFFWVLFRLVK
jgi:hypothetical protein